MNSRSPVNRNDDTKVDGGLKNLLSGTRILVILVVVVSASIISISGFASARNADSHGSISAIETEHSEWANSVRGEPELEVYVPSNSISPGQTHQLEIVIANDGEISSGLADNRNSVTKARNVRVTIESDEDDPITVDSGTQAIGSITENKPKSTVVQITVAEDATPGEYDLDVEIEYSYTTLISERSEVTSDQSDTITRTITIELDDDAQFAVVNTSSTAPIDDTGTLFIEVENTGNQIAYDSRVTATSKSSKIDFQGSNSDEFYVGTWMPGEVKTVRYDLAVRDGASVRPYPLDISVKFDDGDGIERIDDGIVASVTPLSEQTLVTTLVESDLRVGEDGEIVGEITNNGPHPINEVVITFPDGQNILPKESEYSIDSLVVGESEEFRIPIEVSTEAEPVRKQFDLHVRYENLDGDVRQADGLNVHAEILNRRDEFVIEPVDSTLDSGTEEVVSLRITNNLDESVNNVHVKLFVDEPFSSDDDEAFVSSLDPGESREITFDVQVDEKASQKTHSLSMDVKYDDEAGETELSDTYNVPVEVQERQNAQIGYEIPGVLLVILAGVGGFWWYRRAN